MKIKVEDKKIKKAVEKEFKDICKKYNVFPMLEIDITKNEQRRVLYELDKLTSEEKAGN